MAQVRVRVRPSVEQGSFAALWLASFAGGLLPPSFAQAEEAESAAPVAVEVTPPQAISNPVSYPIGEKGEHSVVVELTVDASGQVQEVTAVSGPPAFREAALSAAPLWRFEPARRGALSVPARIRMLVRFRQPAALEPPTTAVSGKPGPVSGAMETRANAAGTQLDTSEPEFKPKPEPEEIVVRARRSPALQRLSQAEVKQLPGAFGDPYRAVEVLPGVTPIVSGLPYFYVRGAPPGNVGYYFDGISVPALYHLGFGPGVLHPAFVNGVELHAGATPIWFGDATAGVVSGTMAQPDYEWRGQGTVRLLDSGGMLEAPFDEGRGSVMLGGRYSYTGALLSALDSQVRLDYWDYQSRVRYDLDDHNTLELVAFGSADYLGEARQGKKGLLAVFDSDFHRAELRWEQRLGGAKLRQAVTVGRDHSLLDDESVEFESQLAGTRTEYSQQLSPALRLRAGASARFERIGQRLDKPPSEIGEANEAYELDENGNEVRVLPDDYAPAPGGLSFSGRDDLTVGAYLGATVWTADGLTITPGLRADHYVFGKRRATGVAPRLMTQFSVNKDFSIIHDIGLTHQPPSFSIPIPGAKPELRGGLQRGFKHSVGATLHLPWGLTGSSELFHNLFYNMTDLLGVEQLAEGREGGVDAIRARGRSYGLELSLRRNLARGLGGMISYTLSRSERGLSAFRAPAGLDRTHVLNAATALDLGRHWRLGSRFLFYTGIPAKLRAGRVKRHPPRTPPYWRLDWRLSKRWTQQRGAGYWELVFEVLNTTLNREIESRDCSQSDCVDERSSPITLPSIGLEAAF